MFKKSRRLMAMGLATLAVAAGLTATGTVVTATPASAHVPDGSSLAPPMGWNTWYNLNTQFTAKDILETADAFVSTGLRDVGYNTVGLDGGWWTNDKSPGRDANGNIIVNSDFFNGTSMNTMKQVVDYVHARGLKFGIYTDTGVVGCGNVVWGSGGNETQDAAQFAAWGVDHVKVDHCGGNVNGRTTPQSYAAWRDAIAASGRAMTLDVCIWGTESPWTWGPATGATWRSGPDITFDNGYAPEPRSHITWDQVVNNFRDNNHPGSAGPGAYNDPDYLLIGEGFGLTLTEEQSYFGMWAIAAAPLVLATDVRELTPARKNIVANTEVIAVNQDSAYAQASLVSAVGTTEVWSKPMAADGTRAVLVVNKGASAANITVNWSDIGIAAGSASVRDLYGHQNLGSFSNSYTAASVPSHGSVMYKVAGSAALPMAQATGEHTADYTAKKSIDGSTATMWHSSGGDTNVFPQFLGLDLGATTPTNHLSYTPRQDASSNGIVTSFRVETRKPGEKWSTAAEGTWANDRSVKYVVFSRRDARFVRLVVLSGVGGYASAAEISVDAAGATGASARPISSAVASTQYAGFEATRSFDRNPSTIWHTATTAANPTLTVDLGQLGNVNGFSYLPRQDQVSNPSGGTNGVVTSYRIATSTDGVNFTDVATGTWAASLTTKHVGFTAVQARYVRLTSLAGVNGYASAAEVWITR